MHLLPHEVVNTIDLRPFGLVQLANSTDEEVGLDLVRRTELGVFAAFGRLNVDVPSLRLIVPDSVLNRCVEAHVFVDLVFLSNAHQVGEDLFLAGVFASPLAVLFVAQAVQSTPDIAAAPWVFVVMPRASNTTALLNDNEVATVVAFDKVDGSADSRDAGSDDKDSSVGMVCVANLDFRPRHITRHDCCKYCGRLLESKEICACVRR